MRPDLEIIQHWIEPESKVLDLGCGDGSLLQYLKQTRSVSDIGLEIDTGYVASAQKLLEKAGLRSNAVFQADALTFDDYSDYDIIYFFKPIKDTNLLRQLENRIVATSKPGSILIAPYSDFELRFAELDCSHIAGHLYITQTEPDVANDIKLKAEHIGTTVSAPITS